MRGAKKSEHNPCPVCGLPRGKGPHEFAHGRCAEIRAKTEGREIAVQIPGKKPITADQKRRGILKARAKKYISGRLPKWMFE